jgi:hypothetical protein
VALFACTTILFAFHKTLRTTTGNGRQCNQRLWEIGDIVDVLEAWEANNAKKIVS